MRHIKFVGTVGMVAILAVLMMFDGCKEAEITVSGIKISSKDEAVKTGSTVQLSYIVEPAEAKIESAVWSSSTETVATVDQNGLVTGVAEGTAIITITVNGTFTKRCTVTVEESAPIYTEGYYSGEGIKIGETWWAPVNCGYDAADYPYGKLYQWGRKYGQAYESGTITPVVLSALQGQDVANCHKFGKHYTITYNWFSGPVDDTFWTENSKGTYDPCPSGWRVPTKEEFDVLISHKVWGTNTVGKESQIGYWFNGPSAASKGTGVFLPTAGYRDCEDGKVYKRAQNGSYWSSSVDDIKAWYLTTISRGAGTVGGYRADGKAVRCVQE